MLRGLDVRCICWTLIFDEHPYVPRHETNVLIFGYWRSATNPEKGHLIGVSDRCPWRGDRALMLVGR